MTLHDFLTEEEQKRVLGEQGLARRLPRKVYSDPNFTALEYSGWLDKTWLLVGRAHDIPNPGDVIPVPGHPIFLARDEFNQIQAFYNSCRHRGHVLVDKPCNKSGVIVCPYHHWSYGLDGTLKSATHFSGYKKHTHPELDPIAFGLRKIRTAIWHNWILINVDGDAPSIEEFTSPLESFYHDVDFSNVRHFATVSCHPLEVNWKTAMENNIEPYHVPMVHPNTAGRTPL